MGPKPVQCLVLTTYSGVIFCRIGANSYDVGYKETVFYIVEDSKVKFEKGGRSAQRKGQRSARSVGILLTHQRGLERRTDSVSSLKQIEEPIDFLRPTDKHSPLAPAPFPPRWPASEA